MAARFEVLATFPRSGRPVPDISGEHYLLTHDSYLIIYRVDEAAGRVILLRVVHGARDWLALFG
ncbi:type II toxin-antitoxin system RelE/ParE family toxin [Asticcacaulis sp.]|uniref:type II toxin-antitoxin system RelE/ParE family toxin n=1 Tax=Asticcacaulis sp. TaxID=1872648 RepID=UPI00345A43C9